MIHASVELVEAMAGVAPSDVRMWPACGSKDYWASVFASTYAGPKPNDKRGAPDARVVTCPACLVAMDAAREGRLLHREGK